MYPPKPIAYLDARGPLVVPYGGEISIPVASGVFFTKDGDETLVWNFPIVPLTCGIATAGLARNDVPTVAGTFHRGLFAYSMERYLSKLQTLGIVPVDPDVHGSTSEFSGQRWVGGVDWGAGESFTTVQRPAPIFASEGHT